MNKPIPTAPRRNRTALATLGIVLAAAALFLVTHAGRWVRAFSVRLVNNP